MFKVIFLRNFTISLIIIPIWYRLSHRTENITFLNFLSSLATSTFWLFLNVPLWLTFGSWEREVGRLGDWGTGGCGRRNEGTQFQNLKPRFTSHHRRSWLGVLILETDKKCRRRHRLRESHRAVAPARRGKFWHFDCSLAKLPLTELKK